MLTLNDRVLEVLAEEETQAWNVQIGGRTFEVETGRGAARRRQQQRDQFEDGRWRLTSPLTGVVVEIRVKLGDQVERGEILMVVEAMKMLNELRARLPGIVSAIPVAERDRVELGAVLLELTEAPP